MRHQSLPRCALESTEAAAPSVDRDAELVAAARRDARAFPALYDRYVDRVHGAVRLRIADPDRREGVTSGAASNATCSGALR